MRMVSSPAAHRARAPCPRCEQDPSYPAGDCVQDLPIDWVRYDDPEGKAFKLNAERNNGRAAMFGILGMISHAALGEDALFPIISSA